MNTRIACHLALLAAVLAPADPGRGDEPAAPRRSEWLERPDGQRVGGRLAGDPASGFRFVPEQSAPDVPLAIGTSISFEGKGPERTGGSRPFQVELGLDRRISGRLNRVSDGSIRIEDPSAGSSLTVARGGARAVVQRLGEMLILDEGFETLGGSRWRVMGNATVEHEPRAAGQSSLRLPGGECSVTYRLAEPVPSGRLEMAFHDGGEVAPGHQCFVDLLFRGPAGAETVRTVLGWSEGSLSVESPGGPALAVQRLERKPGWHRLVITFGSEQTEIAVDGDELAHGKGPGGPLAEIRLASHKSGSGDAPKGLMGHIDDLRLVRFAEALGGIEVDPAQDEVRLAGGDQVFGTLVDADGQRVRMEVDHRTIVLPWSDVSGVYFRRAAIPSAPVDGLIVRLQWRTAPGDDPRDLDELDGALVALNDRELALDVPYIGRVTVPRERLRHLRVVGHGRRIVIDPTPHHLGNEIVEKPPRLDPPQPEGGVLERSFALADSPPERALLTLDVVQVVGEASGLPFYDLVKKGEIRTSVAINGRPVDYINRYVTTKNETPVRIRIPIPAGVLRSGRNLVRIEQAGEASDPDSLDDLGILEIAVEFPPDRAGGAGPKQP